MMAKVRINVHTAFTLVGNGKDTPEYTTFAQGTYDLEDKVANHWFVKAHSVRGAAMVSEPVVGDKKPAAPAAADTGDSKASGIQ